MLGGEGSLGLDVYFVHYFLCGRGALVMASKQMTLFGTVSSRASKDYIYASPNSNYFLDTSLNVYVAQQLLHIRVYVVKRNGLKPTESLLFLILCLEIQNAYM